VNVADVIVAALVGLSVLVAVLSCVGVLLSANAYDSLHFTSPASVVSPVLLAIAVVIQEGIGSQAGVKSIIVALLLVVLNTVLVHATARAARIRAKGRWVVESHEKATMEAEQ
jgi:multisubunit Na+/H+ antiporter MnhG subunit